MLLAHVEAFLEIVRHGSVSRAAEALFITQPGLSARLRALEQDLGTPLFIRTREGMELTSAGRAFLPYATRAREALHDGVRLVHDVDRGMAGELVLGATPVLSTYVLPGVVRRYAKAYPNVRLRVRTEHTEVIMKLVLDKEIEVGLSRDVHHPLARTIPFYEDEVVLVVDPAHRLAGADKVGVERMRDDRLILFDKSSSYYQLTLTILKKAFVTPRSVLEVDNIEAAKKMVEEGLGVAFLPSIAVGRELAEGRLERLPLELEEPIRRRMVIVQRDAADSTSHVLGGFISLLRRVPEFIAGARAPGL